MVAVFGSSTAILYVNGVQVASGVTAFSGIAPQTGATSIGGAVSTRFHNATANSGNNFAGTIDEVALYNSALTAAQVVKHYAAAGLLAGDTDVDSGDIRTVTKVNGLAANVGTQITLPSKALLTVQADGSYDYDPNGAFDYLKAGGSATDSFTYAISDSSGAVSTASVTITVLGKNDVPTGAKLSSRTVTVSDLVGTLSATDIDLADSHTYTIIDTSPRIQSGPVFGIQVIKDVPSLVVLDRSQLVVGETRVVTIRVTDESLESTDQAFRIFVAAAGVPNLAPTANPDNYRGSVLAVQALQALANDTDPENDPLTITHVNGTPVTFGSEMALAFGRLEVASTGRNVNFHFFPMEPPEFKRSTTP